MTAPSAIATNATDGPVKPISLGSRCDIACGRSKVSGSVMRMRPRPIKPRIVIIAVIAITRNVTSDFKSPPPSRNKRAEAAGADQGHAGAEHQTADDGAAPLDARAGIDRARQVETAPEFERVHADDGDRRCQNPGAGPAHILGIDDVFDRGDGTKAAAAGDKAKQQPETKTQQCP